MSEHTTYTVKEAARILKVRPATIRKLAHGGELKNTRIGGQFRFTGESLKKFLGLGERTAIVLPPDPGLAHKRRQRTAARKKRQRQKRH